MQVKVPQPLIAYEDKVIGPFTFRQFVYIVLGLGLAATVIFIFPGPVRIIGYILAVPIVAVFGAMAFLKLHGRSPETMFKAFVISTLRSRYQVWRKDLVGSRHAPAVAAKPKAAKAGKKKVYEIRSSLEKLATIVDTSGVSGEEAALTETTRVARPEAEVVQRAEEPEAKDVIEDEERAANLRQAMETAETPAAPAPSEPVVSDISKPVKRYDYDYQRLEVNPIEREEELTKMVYQYHREHPKKPLKVIKHGERVQLVRPLEQPPEE